MLCYYRKLKPQAEAKPKPRPARSLSDEERQQVLQLLHSQRFVDQSPQEVYATLLDEGTSLGSIRTLYRILHDHTEVRDALPPRVLTPFLYYPCTPPTSRCTR